MSDHIRRYTVTVRLKPEVLDPEGRAILATLQRLGHDKLKHVRIAKRYELEFAPDRAELARDRESPLTERVDLATVRHIAAQLLANPVAEVYQIETEP